MTDSRHVDVASYVLGVLDSEDHEEFERHLLDCPLCRIELTELQAAASALDILRVSAGVGGGVEEAAPAPAAPVRPARWTFAGRGVRAWRLPTSRRRSAVVAVAACLLLLGAVFAASTPESAPNATGPLSGEEETVAAEEPTAPVPSPSTDPTSRSSTLVSGADDGEEEDEEEPEEDEPDTSADEDDESDLGSRSPRSGVTVDYSMQAWSDSNFGGQLTITNTSSRRMDDWEVEIGLERARVAHAWDMAWDRTHDGARMYPADWEDGIAPGETRTLYFTAWGSPQTPRCTINGRSCDL